MKPRNRWVWVGFLLLLTMIPATGGAAVGVKNIATGGEHSLAIRTDGTLWAWGSNDVGQLGLHDTTDRYSPTLVRFPAAPSWLLLLLD
jgi:hypothetical protein